MKCEKCGAKLSKEAVFCSSCGAEIVDKEEGSKKILTVLDSLYEKALVGVPKVSEPVSELAADYMRKNDTPEEAARSLIKYQVAKCTTSGFVTGLGGLLTLPVAIPANLTTVWYVQLRMIAAIATIGGYDPSSDQVQTLAYACLTGQAVTDIVKGTGIKIGEKITVAALKKLPGTVLTKINRAVGFRLLTKFGTKGTINLVKGVPVVGGVVGGAIDFGSTKIIGKNAYRVFIEK